ncbi:hypothetical protein OUZ56_033782 [Daphnia magna]|uniref:Uncharacterized protein n=1 Tax=Daphnia magna TaxID=35525 RepID=A0ABR0AU81_9CRUS|nr:hypothetical protein OUZ56_021691 [Daphnia magna]KAK4045792.1 hypothetical protein OUZ56_033782 [Daphnia magna]
MDLTQMVDWHNVNVIVTTFQSIYHIFISISISQLFERFKDNQKPGLIPQFTSLRMSTRRNKNGSRGSGGSRGHGSSRGRGSSGSGHTV